MNSELERLILAYEQVSASKDKEARDQLFAFEALIDKVMDRHPKVLRDNLRKSVIRAHRKWALQQDRKPPAIPPKA
jgi:ribosomal 50S subunit-associated protein YjgA (DUF615 family)